MSVELGRRLLFSGAVGSSEIQAALFRHLSTGTPFVRALLDGGALTERALEAELTRASSAALDTVVPVGALVDRLPPEACRKLMAVPVRQDPRTGMVDVAVVDPFDGHVASELGFHLKADVRLLRGTLRAIEQAISRIENGEISAKVIVPKVAPSPVRSPSDRPPSGPPIPLVRRAARGDTHDDADDAIEVLGVRDIVEQSEGDGDGSNSDEHGQPILHLRTSRVPRAPGVPHFAARAQEDAGSPETTRGPFSPRAPVAPFAGIEDVLAGFDDARTRDEVVDGLITGMSTVARRVGAFAVKKGSYRGLACNSDLGDVKEFREIEISTGAATVFGIAASKGSYLGPLPATPPHETLLRFMRGTSGEVAAVLISIAGRPAVVLFADALGDTLIATRRAEELGREASRAFSRILTEAKSDRRGGG